MKWHMILVVGFVLAATGCDEKEQLVSEPVDEAPMTTPAAAPAAAGNEIWRNESFRKHMHLHAEKLDDLNFALADGDLKAAKAQANWLATHDIDSDVQSDWLSHVYRMRTAAEAVEAAPDLDTARAAAERISEQCQECHAAVGINTE